MVDAGVCTVPSLPRPAGSAGKEAPRYYAASQYSFPKDWCRAVDRYMRMSDEELVNCDIAELNLTLAFGLPGAETLDVPACLKTLDAWAELVCLETARCWPMFLRLPEEFDHSPGRFRILALVTVLQRDLGVRYNPLCREVPTTPGIRGTNSFTGSSWDVAVHVPRCLCCMPPSADGWAIRFDWPEPKSTFSSAGRSRAASVSTSRRLRLGSRRMTTSIIILLPSRLPRRSCEAASSCGITPRGKSSRRSSRSADTAGWTIFAQARRWRRFTVQRVLDLGYRGFIALGAAPR